MADTRAELARLGLSTPTLKKEPKRRKSVILRQKRKEDEKKMQDLQDEGFRLFKISDL